MLFASTDLARRIEAAEVDFLSAFVAATKARRPDSSPLMREIAGGVALLTEPGSPLNKLLGLGFGGPIDAEAIAEVEREFDARGIALQVEVASLGDPEVVRFFSRRGYTLFGFENVLGRDLLYLAPAPESDIAVSTSPDPELALWAEVVITGFATPDIQGVASHESFPREAMERVMLDMAGVPELMRFTARLDGRVAGCGSMRLTGAIAQLCGAATLPELRRRGVQTALLEARLHFAAAHGCTLAIVTTAPGSKSQENMQRRGFEPLYTRAILLRERPS